MSELRIGQRVRTPEGEGKLVRSHLDIDDFWLVETPDDLGWWESEDLTPLPEPIPRERVEDLLAAEAERDRLREQVARMDAEESAEADRQAALLLDALDRAARAETERGRLRTAIQDELERLQARAAELRRLADKAFHRRRDSYDGSMLLGMADEIDRTIAALTNLRGDNG